MNPMHQLTRRPVKAAFGALLLALAAAMSLSLIVPASAVYCPHDYYASTAVWYTDDGPRLQTRHWQMTIRCRNCGYADAEKEHTFPVRLELPEGCSVLVCRNLRVIGSAPVAV